MDIDKTTERIIGCAMKVSNMLGVGFVESVYRKARMIELESVEIIAEQEKSIKVYYRNRIVGDFFADILVDNCVILELKVSKAIDDIHKAQLLNYLKATKLKVGLILNFGTKSLGVKRMML